MVPESNAAMDSKERLVAPIDEVGIGSGAALDFGAFDVAPEFHQALRFVAAGAE